MSDDTYLSSLRQARIDLAHAIEERDQLNLRILRLQQLVKALSSATNEGNETFEHLAARLGFTDAVLTVLRNSKGELTARNIRDRMVEMGYELGRYANPLGFIHTVLNRLVAQGKIRQSAPGCFVAIQTGDDLYWAAVDSTRGYSAVVPTKPTTHEEKMKAIEEFPQSLKRKKK